MTRQVEQVLDDALALDESDRAKLVVSLVESLDGPPDPGLEEEWAAEIQRRLARIEAGQATMIPMEDALARFHRAARAR